MLRDWFVNLYLSILSRIRYIFNIKHHGKSFDIPDDYDLIFYDDFKTLESWYTDMNWGLYHPNDLTQWWDKSKLSLTSEGINITADYNPRYFPEIDTTIPIGTGVICSKNYWEYGIYRSIIKLPRGKYLWPAFWTCGATTWPPEIDILEAWSNDTIDYKKGRKLTFNVHYGENPKSIRSRKRWLPNKITSEYLEYVLWWEADFIRIYYNGYKVYECADKKILEYMKQHHRIIFGAATKPGFEYVESPMTIKFLEIWQK